MKFKLAYFVTHPIQYQAPLLRLLAQSDSIDLTVFFLCNPSAHKTQDIGFGKPVQWDIPLLEGYKHVFIESEFDKGGIGFKNPRVNLEEFKKYLVVTRWDAVWFHGYINKALLYGMWICKENKIPFFFRAESNLTCTSRGFLKDRLIRWIVKNSAGLLYIGQLNKEYYLSYGADPKKLFFVPYAVDNRFFQERVISKKSNDKIIFLYASKFIERKNPKMLVEAYALAREDFAVNESELWLIGDGPEKESVQQAILNSGRRDIKILGFKNQTELPEFYSQCDVFILPSEKEPFGLVVNEVMNFSKPVLTTDEVGSAKDLIHDNKNGWVIKANSRNELARVIKKVISGVYNLEEMGRESLKIINEWNFDKDLQGLQKAVESVKKDHGQH